MHTNFCSVRNMNQLKYTPVNDIYSQTLLILFLSFFTLFAFLVALQLTCLPTLATILDTVSDYFVNDAINCFVCQLYCFHLFIIFISCALATCGFNIQSCFVGNRIEKTKTISFIVSSSLSTVGVVFSDII